MLLSNIYKPPVNLLSKLLNTHEYIFFKIICLYDNKVFYRNKYVPLIFLNYILYKSSELNKLNFNYFFKNNYFLKNNFLKTVFFLKFFLFIKLLEKKKTLKLSNHQSLKITIKLLFFIRFFKVSRLQKSNYKIIWFKKYKKKYKKLKKFPRKLKKFFFKKLKRKWFKFKFRVFEFSKLNGYESMFNLKNDIITSFIFKNLIKNKVFMNKSIIFYKRNSKCVVFFERFILRNFAHFLMHFLINFNFMKYYSSYKYTYNYNLLLVINRKRRSFKKLWRFYRKRALFSIRYDRKLKFKKFFSKILRINKPALKIINKPALKIINKPALKIVNEYKIIDYSISLNCLVLSTSVKFFFKKRRKRFFKKNVFKLFELFMLEILKKDFFKNYKNKGKLFFKKNSSSAMISIFLFKYYGFNLFFFKKIKCFMKGRDVKYNCMTPVFFLKRSVMRSIITRFQKSYAPDLHRYMYYYIFNFFEFFLKKTIILKLKSHVHIFKSLKYLLNGIFYKYRYFQLRIGKGFFFFEMLELLWLTFFYKDLNFLISWLVRTMQRIHYRNHKKFLNMLKFIITQNSDFFVWSNNVKGFFFDIRGKVGTDGNAKKRHFSFYVGKFSKTTKQSKFDYQFGVVRTLTGALGLTIIMYF